MLIDNRIIAEEIRSLTRQGLTAKLRAKGQSMRPTIRNHTDSIVISAVSTDDIRCGDIVMADTAEGFIAVHRITRIDGDDIVLRGDGNPTQREHCRRSDIIGLITAIERGGRLIDPYSTPQRLKTRILVPHLRLYRMTRAAVGRILRLLHLRS